MAGRSQAKPDPNDQAALVERQLHAAQRLLRLKQARESLLDFTVMSMPDPDHIDDPHKSRYTVRPHHEFIANQLEEVISGETPWLILSVPPRMGKSELVSRRLPGWFIGREPYSHTIVTSYGEELAMDFGREVREIMQSAFYQQVFPGTHLRTGSRSAERLQTLEGGMVVFTGMGGTITGRGADCLPADTLIETDRGPVQIQHLMGISSPCKVLGYETDTNQLVYKDLEAVASRQADGLYRITTARGRVVEATGNHPFLTPGGYVHADSLAPGDRLLCAVREGSDQGRIRVPEVGAEGRGAALLQPEVLVRDREREDSGAVLPGLQFARPPEQEDHLFGRVPEQAPVRETKGGGGNALLPRVQRFFRAVSSAGRHLGEVLLAGVRRPGPFAQDVVQRQPEVEGRGYAFAAATPLGQGFPGDAPEDSAPGWAQVRVLRGHPDPSGGTPHQQRADGQPGPELGDALRPVSQAGPPGSGFRAEPDEVVLVERVRGETTVYDIQVADTHNFFANGVCVHNCLIIDDPIKDRESANSRLVRNKHWDWFRDVAMSRLMGAGRVVICMTRWHEDDIVGRITNPRNEHYDEKFAKDWKVVNIPAFAEEDDPVGREPGEVLWPERSPRKFLETQRRINPAGFSALYMGRPAPPEGDFFKSSHLNTYASMSDLPKNLRFYAASDHAISLDQQADKTCMGVVGVDEDNNIYVLPDLVWRKLDAEHQIDSMLGLMREHRPLFWWAEKGHISKSLGPFLRKRMLEEGVYSSVVEKTPAKDKMTRAQPIQGRMAMGKVFFPRFAPWWPDAKDQLLNFPHTQHDDFIDFIAWVGIGLSEQVPASRPVVRDKTPRTGTIQWIKASSERLRQEKRNDNRYLS